MKKLIQSVLALALLSLPAIARGATLTDTPEFTANEIYEMQATDPVEGAAIGASFGGIGIDNQPHQQLANRTALLNNHRITDEGNISVIQAFDALLTGTMGQNGYVKLPVADTNLGQIQYIVQWGLVDFGTNQNEGLYGPYNFPLAFPHTCEVFTPMTLTPESPTSGGGDGVIMVSTQWRPTASQFWVWNNQIGTASGAARGFYWIAIGY
jgi:hypothetical protein